MTLEQFKTEKARIRTSLEAILKMDTLKYKRGLPVRELSLITKMKHFTVKDDSKNIAKELSDITAFIANKLTYGIKCQVIQSYLTERKCCYRSASTIGITYSVAWGELRTKIEDEQVENIMKAYVRKMLTKPKKRKHSWELVQLDCKIMDLFKDGKITWEDCVKSHNTDCST